MKPEQNPLDETRAARIREEGELGAEFEAHVAHRVDDLLADGLSPRDAADRARTEFGDAERLKAESRAVRSQARRRLARASRIDAFLQDCSYSLRQLRRSPGFAMTALVTLMLGVGVTATIVSVVDAVAFAAFSWRSSVSTASRPSRCGAVSAKSASGFHSAPSRIVFVQ